MSGYEAENPELQAGPTQAATPAASSDNQRGTQDEALGCGGAVQGLARRRGIRSTKSRSNTKNAKREGREITSRPAASRSSCFVLFAAFRYFVFQIPYPQNLEPQPVCQGDFIVRACSRSGSGSCKIRAEPGLQQADAADATRFCRRRRRFHCRCVVVSAT